MSGSVLNTFGRVVYQLGFQCSPIIFTNGIASNFGIEGYLPIVFITEAANFVANILSGSDSFNLDNFFAHFTPVPGGTIAKYSIGQYPFANQSVAANAIIAEPLTLSMKMSIPVKSPGGHTAKLVTMEMLQAVVETHARQGGTYTVVTPASIYTNMILTGLTDVSSGANPIPQNTWQWDFVQPLVSLQAAQGALNNFLQNVSNSSVTKVPGQ
jgi:hypothetical protein